MEELKLIIEAINGLGENAKYAFIWWLIIDYILRYVFVSGTILCILYTAYKVIFSVIKNNSLSEQIKSLMGYYENGMTWEHKLEIINILKEYKGR